MVTKASVVNKTVQGLAPAHALQMLSTLADRLQSRPVRSQGLHTWLRSLLLYHASYFTAAPGGCLGAQALPNGATSLRAASPCVQR